MLGQESVRLLGSGWNGTFGDTIGAVVDAVVELSNSMPMNGCTFSALGIVAQPGGKCTNPFVASLLMTVIDSMSPQSAVITGPFKSLARGQEHDLGELTRKLAVD